MDLNSSIINLKGIGEKSAKLFEKLNIHTVNDLLHYYPRDYEKFEEPVMISQLQEEEVMAVRGIVIGNPTQKKVRNLTITNMVVQDATGSLLLTFFNMPYIKSSLKSGEYYIFRGLVQKKGTTFLMEQPKFYKDDSYKDLMAFIQPVYSVTKGLSNQHVIKAMKQALSFASKKEDMLPGYILEKYQLMDCNEAQNQIHFPEDFDQLMAARKSLVFEEFFLFIYFVRQNKEYVSKNKTGFSLLETADTSRYLEALPYELTNAQKKVWDEIRNDITGEFVMNRLVQGDVGSGKTIIAVLALLLTAANGYQGALMAPTEVLAKQHFDSISSETRKHHLAFKPVLLTGSMTAKEKREAYELIKNGEVNLIIGTHALIQEKVEYKNLALVVTDEQHRFGVRQRETLANKGFSPHVLVMSATPIPRTLAIIIYGDLDISIIDELPSNRLPIKNCVVNTDYREKAYQFITKEVDAGRQVYVICPMVEEGESEDMENVLDYTKKLKNDLPSSIQIAYLHGKMRPADKNKIMEEFALHHIDVLVSTTVIEVGINVPNATVMMVENAERFGLAQLHQLRGRVGRGEHQSYCIFVSGKNKKETMERLKILNKSNDGFFIASEDLRLRGPGDVFGIRQSGELQFKIGDIFNDADVLKNASECVDDVLASDEDFKARLLPVLNAHIDLRTI